MKKLDEWEIAEAYIGKKCNKERISSLCHDNGVCSDGDNMYIAYCYYCDEDECKAFGITDILYDKWDYNGIDFRVNIFTKDDAITQCNIFKYKETSEGFGRGSGYELLPTQQEIRVFRRIMDYVTTE